MSRSRNSFFIFLFTSACISNKFQPLCENFFEKPCIKDQGNLMFKKLSLAVGLIFFGCAGLMGMEKEEENKIIIPQLQDNYGCIDYIFYHPDQKKFFFTNTDGEIYGWDYNKQKKAAPLFAVNYLLYSMAISPEGTQFFYRHFLDHNCKLSMYDCAKPQNAPKELCSDFRFNLFGLFDPSCLSSLKTLTPEHKFIKENMTPNFNEKISVAFSSDGKKIALGFNGWIGIFEDNKFSGTPLKMNFSDNVECVAFSHNNTKVAFIINKPETNNIIAILDSRSGEIETTFNVDRTTLGKVSSITWVSENDVVFVATRTYKSFGNQTIYNTINHWHFDPKSPYKKVESPVIYHYTVETSDIVDAFANVGGDYLSSDYLSSDELSSPFSQGLTRKRDEI